MNTKAAIAAVSTPPGKGGVAIIRISGDGAFDIAEKVFVPKGSRRISDYAARFQIFGNIVYRGEEIDDGLLTLFKAPASYTGEDVAEISCHGGALVTRTVLEAVFAAGAISAEAGEFTRRALLNGKLSLTEAEAVGNLLEAKTHAQIMLNTEKSRSLLSGKLREIRASLTDTLSSMYARIDYPDEDLGDFSDEELLKRLGAAKAECEKLISSYKTGRAISLGIETVICGKPNAGKSSLYNLLVGENAAIVTDIKGTTRDILTSEIPLGKLLLRLSDTAGVRDAVGDKIELIGIEKTKEKISSAELILALFDAKSDISSEDLEIIRETEKSCAAKIAVLNKCEGETKFPKEILAGKFDAVLEISVKDAPTDARLTVAEACDRLFTDEKIVPGEDALISNARQNASLLRARDFIASAKEACASGLPQDIASSDIERALSELAELDGVSVTDEVLNGIFSKFCVGK